MSYMSSLFIGYNGLNANIDKLNALGHNVANMNSVGYKAEETTFAELVRSFAGGGRQVRGTGTGPVVAERRTNFSQGDLSFSPSQMDWAIEGRGFYVVDDAQGNTFYTRAGQFKFLVAKNTASVALPTNEILQGYKYNATEQKFGNELGSISMDLEMKAKASTKVQARANLDASAAIVDKPFDAADPTSYTYATSQVVHSAQDDGVKAHTLTLYFAKTDSNAWATYAAVDDGEAVAGTALTFSTDGVMTDGAAQSFSLEVPVGEDSTVSQSLDVDLTGTTQYGVRSVTHAITQDGHGGGTLVNISVNPDGVITGYYTNQRHQVIAKVGLAQFDNVAGLRTVGEGKYAETGASGEPSVKKRGSDEVKIDENGEVVEEETLTPEEAAAKEAAEAKLAAELQELGQIRSGMIELSNVKVEETFVDIIEAQFGFQAGSRAVTAIDEMLQTTINLRA